MGPATIGSGTGAAQTGGGTAVGAAQARATSYDDGNGRMSRADAGVTLSDQTTASAAVTGYGNAVPGVFSQDRCGKSFGR